MAELKTCLLLVLVVSGALAELALDNREAEPQASSNLIELNQFEPIRGVWLTNTDGNYNSAENLRNIVRECYDSNINSIFMSVWTLGYTQYQSDVMRSRFGYSIQPEYAGRDPLQEVIDEAKKYNIKVYAWLEFGFACSVDDYPDSGILEKYPYWTALNSTRQPVQEYGIHWMNSFHPEVQSFVSSLFLEVAQKYDIAGIQGDDRFPGLPSEGGYDDYTKTLYRNLYGIDPPVNYQEPQWLQFRADLLTNYLMDFRQSLSKIKSGKVPFLSAPPCYPYGLTYLLQDWPTWYKLNLADLFSPQVYEGDLSYYTRDLDDIIRQTGSTYNIQPGVLLKLGDYVATEDLLTKMVQSNRYKGFIGEIFFYNVGLTSRTNFFHNIYPNIKKAAEVQE